MTMNENMKLWKYSGTFLVITRSNPHSICTITWERGLYGHDKRWINKLHR